MTPAKMLAGTSEPDFNCSSARSLPDKLAMTDARKLCAPSDGTMTICALSSPLAISTTWAFVTILSRATATPEPMLTMLCCPSAVLKTTTRTTLRDAALMSLASANAGTTKTGARNRKKTARYRMMLSMAGVPKHQRGSGAGRSADGAA